MSSTPIEKSGLDRALSVFADVKAGEGWTALLLATNVFVLLSAYYIVKPVREALILALESGAEYKSYMSAAIALLLLLVVPLYARVADRLPKLTLVVGASLFFASHLVVFWLLNQFPSLRAQLGLVFYGWVGVFNMMVVAQFWAYANDVYDEERGKRLFAFVALGASLGAALGAKIAAALIPLFGVPAMLLVSAALLVVCAGLFLATDRARPPRTAPVVATSKPDRSGAFAQVFAHRYLLLLAALSLVFNCVNTNGEYLLGKLVKVAAAEAVQRGELAAGDQGKFIGAFYGDFFFWVNLLGVGLQSFLVSRIVKYFGIKVGLLALPMIALGNSVALLVAPVLSVVRVGKTLENGTDYSLHNTVRQMLWLPTTEEMKYKAKQAVDTFFVRLGDVASALVVYVGSSLLAWDVREFAVVNVVLIAIWLVVGIAILRENARLHTSRAPADS